MLRNAAALVSTSSFPHALLTWLYHPSFICPSTHHISLPILEGAASRPEFELPALYLASARAGFLPPPSPSVALGPSFSSEAGPRLIRTLTGPRGPSSSQASQGDRIVVRMGWKGSWSSTSF